MNKLAYEIAWARGVEEDIQNFSEKLFWRVVSKLDYIANSNNPFKLTETLQDFPKEIRKFRVGDYRVFIYIKKITDVIYCLSVKHRKEAYKTQSKKEILTTFNKTFKAINI